MISLSADPHWLGTCSALNRLVSANEQRRSASDCPVLRFELKGGEATLAVDKTRMKIDQTKVRRSARASAGFSLLEGVVGFGIFGICFGALLAGLTLNVSTIKYARETVRATQIMEEKLDTIRLYTWDKINTPGYISNQFYAPFFPTNSFNTTQSSGVIYTGLITIATAPVTETYQTNLVQVTIDLYWPSTPQLRHAQMITLVGKYGLQTYIY